MKISKFIDVTIPFGYIELKISLYQTIWEEEDYFDTEEVWLDFEVECSIFKEFNQVPCNHAIWHYLRITTSSSGSIGGQKSPIIDFYWNWEEIL